MFVNKIVFFSFLLKIIRNKKQKMKFGKYKDRRTVRVGNHKDWKMYRSKEYGKVRK